MYHSLYCNITGNQVPPAYAPAGQAPQQYPALPAGQAPQQFPPVGQAPQQFPPVGQAPQQYPPAGQAPQQYPPVGQPVHQYPPNGQAPPVTVQPGAGQVQFPVPYPQNLKDWDTSLFGCAEDAAVCKYGKFGIVWNRNPSGHPQGLSNQDKSSVQAAPTESEEFELFFTRRVMLLCVELHNVTKIF